MQWQVAALAEQHPRTMTKDGDYVTMMGAARFCLIPRGQSAWTRRAFEAFFAGCVPVFLADHVELPFEAAVDYSKMTVKWPADRIDSSLVRGLLAAACPGSTAVRKCVCATVAELAGTIGRALKLLANACGDQCCVASTVLKLRCC